MATVMKRRAVFLDLNGTLVLPIMVQRPEELKLIDDATSAVATLSKADFVCPVVTVQSKIGKGVFSLEDFKFWFSGLAAELHQYGAELAGPYICPHRFADACPCKKPATF